MSSKNNDLEDYDSIIDDIMNEEDDGSSSDNDNIDVSEDTSDDDFVKDIDSDSLKALNNRHTDSSEDSLFEQFDDDDESADYSSISLDNNEDYAHRFNKLKELSSRQEVSEDVDDIIQRQLETNRNINANKRSNHIAVNLLDVEEESPQYDNKAGDEKRIKIISYTFGGLLVFSVLALFLIIPIISHSSKEVAEEKPQDLNIGEIIGENNDANNNDSSSSGQSNDNNEEEVDIPEDGKKLEYEITTSGDIQSASVAWVNAAGEAEEKTGVSIPWKMAVGAKKNVNPVLAASTNGEGTVTCTIKEDDKEIATKSSSGKSPEVTCQN